jgi:AcrR family transcriptional regulator
MPKLWSATIDAHHAAVREATLAATGRLVAGHGLHHLTMTHIAEAAGIGRATLYRYFPDLDAVIAAWHERVGRRHNELLAAAHQTGGDPRTRLQAVAHAYALMRYETREGEAAELAALVHDAPKTQVRGQLQAIFEELLSEVSQNGDVRSDVPAPELAEYCVSALAAASALRSQAAVRRLVDVVLGSLRPPG